jgi:predicted small secreted protein
MHWSDLNNPVENKKEYLARVKYKKIICKTAKSFKDIIDGELIEDLQYRIITERGFNAISVIEYLNNFYELEEIYIAVYRMNQKSVNYLIQLISVNNIKMNIVLSSFFRENKKYEKWCNDLVDYSKNKKNVNVKFSWIHAKVFLSKTKCNKYIVFEGSGNLSDNARIEQYLIENNKTTYNFHKKWIGEILNV